MNLSSKNKKILLVTDPHQEVDKLAKIMAKEQADKTVCLADWFDSKLYDTEQDALKTCKFLKDNIFHENFTSLIGNHDVPYFYDSRFTICSGWRAEKKEIIKESLGAAFLNIRKKLRWYVWVDNFLCTHAGLHPAHLPPNQSLKKKDLSLWLDRKILEAENALKSDYPHWLFMAGEARGGKMPYGGITWLDFNSEFEPIDGLKQIMGHTASRTIRRHHLDGNLGWDNSTIENLCIDCHLNQYVTITNGKLEVKNYIDL